MIQFSQADWKLLSDSERIEALRNPKYYDPYSKEAYALAEAVGRDAAKTCGLKVARLEVRGRHGSLIPCLLLKQESLDRAGIHARPSHLNFTIYYYPEWK